MSNKDTVLDILEEITGTDEVREDLSADLFEEGFMDSLATVQLLVELQGQLDIQVPVSEFDRTEWNTPEKIIKNVEALKASS